MYSIGEDNHDSAPYMAFIVNEVASGWLVRGDFVVVDNAIVNSGGSADILSDFLWNAPGLDGDPLWFHFLQGRRNLTQLNSNGTYL